ncbi:MAG: peptide/bleomycin uptake transporter [Granulosicoccus sp.]|jgi:peptide/bleomycin uptake transporter
MFQSFFPRPKQFFLSAIAWFLVSLALWHGFADTLAASLSFMPEALPLIEGERPPFLTPEKVWVYQYIVLTTVLFCIAWFFIDRDKWYGWAVCGTALILLVSYFQVQLSVFINDWYGDFYNLIQKALSEKGTSNVTSEEYFGKLLTLLYILVPNIIILVTFSFFTSHYVFRWRTAMNEYYMEHWDKLRLVEGAAQRVQEDTRRFAGIMEGLGSAFVSSVMTLIAFLPLLWNLSKEVTELPLFGAVEGSLVFLALISAAFGTVLLAAVGYRLPGLEFNNQRVEAAYRKELVYGEDDPERAEPPTVKKLYAGVQFNNFKLYFNYLYFNVFRFAYLQGATFIPLIALGPSMVAGVLTFGVYQQISNAFNRVENSFQFLVNSWPTIVDLMSIHKRLMAFESIIHTDTTPPTKETAAI